MGQLLQELVEYRLEKFAADLKEADLILAEKVRDISSRLMKDIAVQNIKAIREDLKDKHISLAAKAIRESIEKNEPQLALDRLHTYAFHIFRKLSLKHKIEFTKEETLNAVFGKYVKFLVENKIVETIMCQRILKSSISWLEGYNDVRNNQSLAHANPLADYEDSLLIVNSVINVLSYVQSVEDRRDHELKKEEEGIKRQEYERRRGEIDDLPF